MWFLRIKEYIDEEEYLSDNYEGNYNLNKYGNEKGIVIELFRKSDKSFFYDYSPVCLIGTDLENWKIDIMKKYENGAIMFSCYSYWYLQEVSCVPIYRNLEWFNNAKIQLEIFWNKVLKYRQLGLEKLKEDIQKEKDDKKMIKTLVKEENDNKKKIKNDSASKKSKTSKNQKNIRDFIILDDSNTINTIDMNKKENSIEVDESSHSSDTDFNEDDIFNNGTNTSFF